MMKFDITENVQGIDSDFVRVAKISYALGCVSVLIIECEHNLKILASDPFSSQIPENLSLLTKYQAQKKSLEKLLSNLII